MLSLVSVLFLFFSSSAFACMPMIPLAQVVGGPLILSYSVGLLVLAISVKCVSFAFLQDDVSRGRSLWLMLAGNLLTTVLGILATIPASAPSAFFFGLGIVLLLCYVPGRRLSLALKEAKGWRLNPWLIAMLMACLYFLTAVLIGLSQSKLNQNDYKNYWILKGLSLTLGLAFGIAFSSLWEEWLVAAMAKKFSERKSFLVPVFRANYLAFGAVLIVLAAQSLPRRLNHPNFLDFGLIFPPAAFAAVECLDACHALPVRMAELRCNLECERIDPEKNQRYCPGFTPCLIACEAKYPAEAALEQAAKVEKTKCNGVCFTNHFKIDCSDTHYYPPGEDGGGKAAKGVAGRGNNADLALAGKAGLDGTPPVRGLPSSGNAKQAANPAASARSEGVAAAIASAEAATAATIASAGKPAASSVRGSTVPMVGDHEKKPESEVATKPAEEHLWNLKGGLKPQHFDQPPAESVLADVVKASIGEASELTLFQRVTRAYRNTRYWYESR